MEWLKSADIDNISSKNFANVSLSKTALYGIAFDLVIHYPQNEYEFALGYIHTFDNLFPSIDSGFLTDLAFAFLEKNGFEFTAGKSFQDGKCRRLTKQAIDFGDTDETRRLLVYYYKNE